MGETPHEAELKGVQDICTSLAQHEGITLACLLEENGQISASAGNTKVIDMTSLASLAAGSVAATGGIAKLMEETGFSVLFHEGKNLQLLMNVMHSDTILVVLFNHTRNLGWIRFQVRKISHDLEKVLSRLFSSYKASSSPFEEVSDSEIDALF